MTVWRLEIARLWRTRRLVALLGVFLVLGFGEPVLTYYLPQLVNGETNGIKIVIPPATPAQALKGFSQNAAQLGILVVVIVAAASVALDSGPCRRPPRPRLLLSHPDPVSVTADPPPRYRCGCRQRGRAGARLGRGLVRDPRPHRVPVTRPAGSRVRSRGTLVGLQRSGGDHLGDPRQERAGRGRLEPGDAACARLARLHHGGRALGTDRTRLGNSGSSARRRWRSVARRRRHRRCHSPATRCRHQIGGVTEIRPVSPTAHITHGGRER